MGGTHVDVDVDLFIQLRNLPPPSQKHRLVCMSSDLPDRMLTSNPFHVFTREPVAAIRPCVLSGPLLCQPLRTHQTNSALGTARVNPHEASTYICALVPHLPPMSLDMPKPHPVPFPSMVKQREQVYHQILVLDHLARDDGPEPPGKPLRKVVHACGR